MPRCRSSTISGISPRLPRRPRPPFPAQGETRMKTGVYPGTFDPITYGHMDIVTRALRVVDRLIIGVALDTNKAPVFDLKLRARMVEGEIKGLPSSESKRVEIKTFSGLLVR